MRCLIFLSSCAELKVKPLYYIFNRSLSTQLYTITNSTEFTNVVLNTVESGSKLDVAYTDYQKAFDRVSHAPAYYKIR